MAKGPKTSPRGRDARTGSGHDGEEGAGLPRPACGGAGAEALGTATRYEE